MDRQQVYKDIQKSMGGVPSFMKSIPDSSLDLEWQLMKRVQMEPGAIPNKYRELIGLAVAAAVHCRYCTFFHTEIARTAGASEAEIEEAVHFAKSVMGWSTYINGMQTDFDQFKREVRQAAGHAGQQMAAAKT